MLNANMMLLRRAGAFPKILQHSYYEKNPFHAQPTRPDRRAGHSNWFGAIVPYSQAANRHAYRIRQQ